jgi:hypothetical protein
MLRSLTIRVKFSFTDVLLHSTPATKLILGIIEIHKRNNPDSSNSNNKKPAIRRPVCSYLLFSSHLPAVLPLRALSLSPSSKGTISISSSLSNLGRGCCERQYRTMPKVQQAAKTHGTTMAAAKAGRYRSVLSLARVFVLLAVAALLMLMGSGLGMLEILGISVVAELVSGCGVVAGSVMILRAR